MEKILCLDVGGTSIKSGIYLTDGRQVKLFETVPTNARQRPLLTTIVSLVAQRLEAEVEIKGVAIASAGVIDSDTGSVIYSGYTIPNYTGSAIKQEIEKVTGLRCEVENDANCAGLAEMWNGAGRKAQSAVCLTVGTGIGGSVFVDGELLKGNGYTAGEIGYMPINGHKFQDIASTTSLVTRVNELSPTKKYTSGRAIFTAAITGDELCIKGIDELLENLATGLVTMMYLLNPEMIILGGGIMAQKDYLADRLSAKVATKMIDQQFAKTAIVFAEHQNNAGMIGALCHFNQKNGGRNQ